MEQKEIYILKEDFVDETEYLSNIRAFDSLEKAKEEMNFIIKEYEEQNNTEDLIVERDEQSYCCYEDGYYNSNHFDITIEKVFLE